MENLIFSLNATIPVFLVMVIGWFLRQRGMLTDGLSLPAAFRVMSVVALLALVLTLTLLPRRVKRT